jgi:hypothetical protein
MGVKLPTLLLLYPVYLVLKAMAWALDRLER